MSVAFGGGEVGTVIETVVCVSGLEGYSCVVPATGGGDDGGWTMGRTCEGPACCVKDVSSIHFMALLLYRPLCNVLKIMKSSGNFQHFCGYLNKWQSPAVSYR